ncbi:MAG: hypothetical protein HDR38_02230 [Treponema sp.]|nr:hypothetical protein [Treponema sp.]
MKKVLVGMCALVACAGMAMAQQKTKTEPSQAELNAQAYQKGVSMGNNSALGINQSGNTCSSDFTTSSEMGNCNKGFREGYGTTIKQKNSKIETEE